ncbi:hypothetical protein N7E81_06975 [Reichenbachiella carrageenanivorans]|uniref:DUF2570 domain-containing protein n=1 Tax=Reichenbachiella carrageenanivorans TaxID=2979869 RepID=A0ABY6D3W6_9BACT|nr:hypothetical protein [Reichenbachiella carrageenanivorans]UXX80841.1 hypothetical protein N7E81_06975 [Reichenbachiella carrageenanivorans]
MFKNIIIAFLVLASIVLVFYANNQSKQTLAQMREAQSNLVLAERNAERARQEEQKAVEAAARARIAERKAQDLQAQLDDCK